MNYLFFFYVLDFSPGFIYTRLAFFSFFLNCGKEIMNKLN